MPDEPELLASQLDVAGVWATQTRVYRTRHDFTIDFLRDDPGWPPPGRQVLVARVALSPLAAGELLDEFTARWHEYQVGTLPEEFRGEEP